MTQQLFSIPLNLFFRILGQGYLLLCDIYGSGSRYKSIFHLHLQADPRFNAVIDD